MMIKLIVKPRFAIIISQLLLLSACSSSLVLEAESDVPAPLVAQLPLSIGIHYDENFRNYVYEENSEDRPNWAISSGTSQIELFDQVLSSMFANLRQVNNITEPEGDKLDAILVPQINEMQFAMPRETRSELYEVWIKYKIQLHDPDKGLIGEWPLVGYGKSSTEFLKGRDKGLNAAINSALRDAGAKFTLNFTRIPEVKQWLASKPEVCDSGVANIC